MPKFLSIVFGFLLFGLFAVAIISGGIMLASNNQATQSIADDPAIRDFANELNETLEDTYQTAVGVEGAVEQSPVTTTTSNPYIDAIGGVWKTLKTVPITIYNLTFGLLAQKIFGNSAYGIVFGVIGAILIIAIVYGVYKLLVTGEA